VTDDRHDERPDRPAWAVVPTMPWSRVQPSERRDTGTATSGQRQREYLPDEDEDSDDREAREEYRRRDEYREREDTEEEGGYRPRRAAPEEDQVDHLGRRRAPDPDGQRGRTAEAERDDDRERESTVRVPHAPNAAYPFGAEASVSGPPAAPTSPAVVALPEPAVGDPEQALAAAKIGYDPVTLHELPDNIYELFRIRESLSSKIDGANDNPSRARLLGLRAVVSRIVGDLRPALSDAKMALVHAEATGQLRRISVAQSRLANVLVRLGQLDEADRLFTQANSPELPDRLRAAIHHYAGKCAFEQDRYIEACQHFEKALELRRDGDPELVAATEIALDALFSRVAERGWGPYPRTRDEILQTHQPPIPTFDDHVDRWGYRDAAGGWPVGPQFADVQPFRDGVAWVRPVGIETWGLIDEHGRLLIDPRVGFLGVGSFSDGMAWVSRDGLGGWVAIDKAGRMVIAAGFDDVRPFRRGIALVRRAGKWGAIERNGRLAVQFAFDTLATGLTDGRYIDGFTHEGLAVVEVGGRKGVIDRAGRVLVPLAYPAIVIHPIAFLFTDGSHRWGAIARNGAPLINPVHASRNSLTAELESLLADARPML